MFRMYTYSHEQIAESINNSDVVVPPCLVNLKNSNLDLFQFYTEVWSLECCKELYYTYVYTNHYELNAD